MLSVVSLVKGLFVGEGALLLGLEFYIRSYILGASTLSLCLVGCCEGWLNALTFPLLLQNWWSLVCCCWMNSLLWMLVVRKEGACVG